MLAVRLGMAGEELGERSIAFGKQAVAPALVFTEACLHRQVGAAQFIESDADRLSIQLTHETADVLALAFQRPVTGDAARQLHGVTQRVR